MDSQDNESSFRASLDDEIVDEEAGVAEYFTNQINGNARKKKASNFTQEEDIVLVSHWFNTSIDAAAGTDQKLGTFWVRILTLYSKNIAANYLNRSDSSLSSRWHTIQTDVNKFQGCFAQIENRNPSCINEEDKILQAKLMFSKLHRGKSKLNFGFEHC